MKRYYYILASLWLIALGFSQCRKSYEVIVPYVFDNKAGSGKFTAPVRQAIEGVYAVSNGSSQFGPQVVLKWSYIHTGTDTLYNLSIFTPDVTYFDLEPKQQVDSLVVAGYWRKLSNTTIGEVRLAVRVKRNGQTRRFTGTLADNDTLIMEGLYGNDKAELNHQLTLTYQRPINARPFSIMAHRSGGRTSDLLPASENSLNIIKLAPRLGATGIEVDVRYTKDGVPILYHDNTLNLRLIQKNGLTGPVEAYTYQQLSTFVRLINGEKIPTLEEALQTVIDNTTLNFVWLDTKYIGPMDKVQAIQQAYQRKAAQAGRTVRIVIGLPSTDAIASYKALPDKTNTPILCELDTSITRTLDARIWAPRWTLGPQTGEIDVMKAEDEQCMHGHLMNLSSFGSSLSKPVSMEFCRTIHLSWPIITTVNNKPMSVYSSILVRTACLLLLTTMAFSQSSLSTSTDSATGQKRGPYALVFSVGGGLSYYSTHLGVPASLEQTSVSRFGLPLTLRAMWFPDHRLRIGLESGWTTMYSYKGSIANDRANVYVSAVPILLVFSMPLAWLSGTNRSVLRRMSVTGGPGYYLILSRLDYLGTVQTTSSSLGWAIAGAYTQPLGPKVRLAFELKWYDAVAAENAAFAAQLQLNWRAFSW